jgi:hypothetical protein
MTQGLTKSSEPLLRLRNNTRTSILSFKNSDEDTSITMARKNSMAELFERRTPTLVSPCETRRLSGFAHGPAFVTCWKCVTFPLPTKQSIRRIVAHVQRVAFPLHNSLRLSQCLTLWGESYSYRTFCHAVHSYRSPSYTVIGCRKRIAETKDNHLG